MMIDAKKAALILGGVLLGVGLLLGFLPISAMGTNCGSAFVEDRVSPLSEELLDSMVGRGSSRDYTGACQDAISGRRAVALAVGIPGLVLLVIGANMKSPKRTEDEPANADPAEPPVG